MGFAEPTVAPPCLVLKGRGLPSLSSPPGPISSVKHAGRR